MDHSLRLQSCAWLYFLTMDRYPRDYLALALDNCASRARITQLVEATSGHIGTFKIGLEQFTRFGPTLVTELRNSGRRIFLDLKLHDIPNTVAKAVGAASELGVDFLTIHTMGGEETMKAAVQAAREARTAGRRPPKLIGVTVLTSISEAVLREELGISRSIPDQVAHLARAAASCGLDGIVCAAPDLSAVRPFVPAGFEIVTPGIRPAGADRHDQSRTATPEEAVRMGATLLVLGRAITGAGEPRRAARGIVEGIGRSAAI